jgi:hypothetical protein
MTKEHKHKSDDRENDGHSSHKDHKHKKDKKDKKEKSHKHDKDDDRKKPDVEIDIDDYFTKIEEFRVWLNLRKDL